MGFNYDTWGGSWGNAWGGSWGQGAPTPGGVTASIPGPADGGELRRPKDRTKVDNDFLRLLLLFMD